MHKKFFAFCLPLVGATALVGSAFSAWVFTMEDSATLNGSITVTDVASDFTVAVLQQGTQNPLNSFDLTLDQGGMGNTEVGVGATSDPNVYDLKITFASADGLSTMLGTHNLTLTWSAEITEANVTKYVNLTAAASGGSEQITSSTSVSDGSITLSNIPLTWQYTSKPTDLASYNSLSSEIGSEATITITVSGEWTSKS